jgi:hypothetical protein
MVKVTVHSFDDPEVDTMLSGADWKILSPQESAVLKNWLLKNSAGQQGKQAPSQPTTPPPSEEQPPEG